MTTRPAALVESWREAAAANAEVARSVRYSVPVPKRRLWNPGQGLLVTLLSFGIFCEVALLVYEIFWRSR